MGIIHCRVCGQDHLSDEPCPTETCAEDGTSPEQCSVDEGAEVGESEPGAEGECIECVDEGEDFGIDEQGGFRVAPEERQSICLDCSGAEEITDWPRRSILRKDSRGVACLHLYHPPPERQLRQFTLEDYRMYLRTVNRQWPDLNNGNTWGRCSRWSLTVSSLRTGSDGRVELVFTSSSGNTWNFEVFNLTDVQPGWTKVIRKALMILPIEHLRIVHLKSIFLDFRVGTNELGGRAGVQSGGANWAFGASTPRRSETSSSGSRSSGSSPRLPPDPQRLAGIGVTYSALNRAWCSSSEANSALPRSEDDINGSFNRPVASAFTILHEFGHLFLNTTRRREDFATDEAFQAASQVPQRLHQHDDLFERFRIGTGYESSGGLSQGSGEGFAEAYRHYMMGHNLRAEANRNREPSRRDPESGTLIQQLLLDLGFPTPQSVQQAVSAVNEAVNSMGQTATG